MEHSNAISVIERFSQLCQDTFGDNLLGVYLHGSLAMGCFHPAKSDLDLLVAVESEPTDDAKLIFMQQVVELNKEAPAKGIEMSIVARAAVMPFQYPTPFVLHFSPMHLGWFQNDPAGYVANMKGTDTDLAAHVTILHRYGKVLHGAPIDAIFGQVPKAAYLDSIMQDTANAREDILSDPIYVTLNLCRVLAYVQEEAVLSKRDGGLWGTKHVPEKYHALIGEALRCYATSETMQPDEAIAIGFAEEMLASIKWFGGQ